MKHTVALLVLLHKPSRASAVSDPPGCAGGLAPIKCEGGYEVGSGQDCEAACNATALGSCCNGYLSCFGFTGSVCPDGSCSGGDYACSSSNISLVVNGCKGVEACDTANISLVVNGCKGDYACSYLETDLVDDGCVGDGACYNSDLYFYGGYIGMIVDACKGRRACDSAASFGGSIGSIKSSCNNLYACIFTATHGGSIGLIQSSCNNEYACLFAGSGEASYNYYDEYVPGEELGAIVDCCNDAEECRGITELPDFCISAAPSVSTAPSVSANPSVTGLPTVTSKPSASANPSVTPTKAGKSAKSSKATKKGNVANEIIKDGLNFQGIEFSMMAGDESLSYDQSVDVGLLSFDFSEEEEEFEDNDIDEDEDAFALRERPFHERKE